MSRLQHEQKGKRASSLYAVKGVFAVMREPQKYTVEELKALTAKYRALTRELKKGEAA
ncbi:Bacteriophage lambda NinG [Pseudomonas amygdali pv. lachrymans]|uniref:Bacteriophage lambda NinG n=1 Tax=Pseudomonas amygdali pv. lachrymans TaxID=53707 RepID=A0AB37R176_PSEAV|nr:Bacteriophage lambda NinG [Pseudomonas amygdali pv. lachrymans]RMM34631.1 Bacteriophage lambda NinG [Pseudomonas amygdali pv. lachrymans]RMP43714.1 Bacteriophage lambda NinG [Pseudomonas amygdali pv. lachrymans]RMU16059.1 Bacteriophage lambda NinG [Pseudomonas amygdali pv. lachrymans]